MTKNLILAFVILLAGIFESSAATPQRGVVRVKLQQDVAATVGTTQRKAAAGSRLSSGVASLDATLEGIKAVSIRPAFPYNAAYAAERARFGLDRWYVVEFDESIETQQAVTSLSKTPGVERATGKVPMKLLENGRFHTLTSAPAANASSSLPFNDPRLSLQWHYHNDGSMSQAVSGADINLFEAWKTETGSSDVIVAIIDGGVDYTHEDLAANMWVNTAELNGVAGVDDDNDGYIDDIYGYNFCTNSGTIYPHSHGTHVAGTVAAVNNNGVGVCGVAGGDGTDGSGVRLMSCQVFDSRSGTSEGDFAAALIYAAEHGASIAQCSWGWESDGYYEQDVVDAIKYFTSMSRSSSLTGGLCVFAAGNTGDSGMYYPACMDEVLSVAAMTYDLQPASYSSYGSWVDITAPGGLTDYDESQGVLSTLPGNTYGYSEGTSMATPHVSGIAALVLSKYGKTDLPEATLKQQIETSVNDFYSANPTVDGLFGSGYVDAAKALNMGDGTAPSAISDFTLLAAQEDITIGWTLPDSDDGNVNYCMVYYSTQPFTADALDGVSSVSVDTKFSSSGDTVTYRLTGLQPLTTYHIALKAVNRWGNASDLSPVKTATTNAGPKMTVDKSSLSLTITSAATVGSGSFTIGNTDEGLLRWSARLRTASQSIRSYSRGIIAPATTPYSGTLGISPYSTTSSTTVNTDEFDRGDYPVELKTWKSFYAYIGDSDTSLPNSMAQLFTVDSSTYPEGFNLTHLYVCGAYGENPTIQIYSGTGLMNQSSLLLEFKPSYFSYYYNIALTEQLYFAPGESFYVVYHFQPQDTPYPLGMGVTEDTSAAATSSYISTDLGKTWTLLSEALKGSRYETYASQATWCITAISNNPDWSQLITLTPSEGELPSGETQTVTVANDGQPLCNGTYKFNIYFDTNESEDNTLKIPVTATVSGYEPVLSVNKIIDFGSLLVGQTKTMTVEVFNYGYGAFAGSNYSAGLYSNKISSTNENFSGPSYLSNGFPARQTTSFDITFAPVEAGSQSGYIVFKDKNGKEFKICVQGTATEPAKIEITPTTVEVGELQDGGDAKEAEFTMANTGKYPLQYVFPKFSDETIEGATSGSVHRFGYAWVSNLNGSEAFEYDGGPNLIDATDITSQFTDYNYFSNEISLGFTFPYYDQKYESVYVTSFGGIVFKPYTDGTWYGPLRPSTTGVAGTGLICAYGYQLNTGPNSKIEYGNVDGRFVVNFENVLAVVEGDQYTTISFHMALSPNGDVEVFYDNYDPYSVFQEGRTLFLGINDLDVADPLTITSSDISLGWWEDEDENTTEEQLRYRDIASGSAFKIVAPAECIVQSLSTTSGIINPGETVTVTATVAAGDDMYAGDTYTDLVVMSNDPISPTALVRFNATITGDSLVAEASLNTNAIDFGNVYRTATARKALNVKNSGRNTLTIEAVTVAGRKFTHDFNETISVPAGQSKDIIFTLPTETEGAVQDMVTIKTSVATRTAALSGTVIGCPDATLSYEEVETTMAAGTKEAHPLTITNNGNEDLEWSMTAGDHLQYNIDLDAAQTIGYTYASSADDSSVKFSWVDIETNGLGTQNTLTYYLSHDYVAVDLPFEFPFYGKKYSKMYIYNAGFVSFTERNDDAIWPEPPSDFPAGTIYTNVIAPYWGLHSMDQTKTAGTFYYVTESQAVVSFMEYGNSMNYGVCFQLILNPDGTFKFQYKGAFDSAIIWDAYGHAGISNEDASEGINLPERYIAFNTAVDFTPTATFTLAPGSSATADVTALGDAMAGTYDTQLTLTTNVPSKESVAIPFTITLTGEAKAAFSDDVTIEHVVGYQSDDYSDPMVQMGAMYSAYVEVTNTGTAPFVVEYIDNQGPQIYDEWFDEYTPAFYTFVYEPELDWETGEPTGNYIWNQYDGMSTYEVGETPLKLSVPMLYECGYTEGTYEIPLVFTISGVEGLEADTVNIKYIVTPAPAMAVDKEEIDVENAAWDLVTDETVVISNQGEYKLSYTLEIDLSGEGYEPSSNGGGGGTAWAPQEQPTDTTVVFSRPWGNVVDSIAQPQPAVSVKPFETGTSENILDLPDKDTFSYLRGLYYPVAPTVSSIYNYGTGTTYDEFKCATAFTAPEDGFTISHIYVAVKPGDLENCEIKVDIINGDDPDGSAIGHGTFAIGDKVGDSNTHLLTIALDRLVYMSPGQQFYVKITYPAGEAYPSTLVPKEEAVVANRYLAYDDTYGWYDIGENFNDSYGSLGYIVSCLETVTGSAWAMLTPETSAAGDVAVGEAVNVKVRISAATAPLETGNKAMLIVKSNDPEMPYLNIPIYLNLNSTPSVIAASSTLLVNEGAPTTTTLTVSDADGDDITVALYDNGGFGTITAVTATGNNAAVQIADDKKSATVAGASEAEVEVTLDPGYETAGSYTFTLSATDSYGHEGSADVTYAVAHTNRAPEVLETADLQLAVGASSAPIDMAAMFSDPDGDDLTFEISYPETCCVSHFVSDSKVIFYAESEGITFVNVTATDPSGASSTASFTIDSRESGIDLITIDGFAAWPNPVVETLYVSTGEYAGEANIAIYSVAGGLVYNETYTAKSAEAKAVDLTGLAAGTYLLQVKTEQASASQILIKQ